MSKEESHETVENKEVDTIQEPADEGKQFEGERYPRKEGMEYREPVKRRMKLNPIVEYFKDISFNLPYYVPKGKSKDELDEAFEKRDIHVLNKILSDAAQERNYSKVIYVYRGIYDRHIFENLYTLTIMVNTGARVGDTILVDKAWKRMRQLDIKPSDVTRTVTIKAYLGSGQIELALGLFYSMNTENIRTINTVLRGLLRMGTDKQIKTFMKRGFNQIDDPTTKEYLASMYTIESANDYIKELTETMKSKDDVTPTTLLVLATYNCLTNNVNAADDLLREFGEVCDDDKDDYRKSIKLFKKHQNSQLRHRRKYIKAYIQNVKANPDTLRPVQFFTQAPDVFQLYPKATEIISFEKVFGNTNPVNIEMCSGYGEWLIDKAISQPKQNWVGLEIYKDRVFNNWATKVFAEVKNVSCIWGDAAEVITMAILPNSIDNIYLNFPEPPKFENAPTNLFKSQFFFQVAKALKTGGTFNLLTDSIIVVKIIKKVFENTPFLGVRFRYEGKEMFVNKMPADYGTSYFDQLWKNANTNEDRYFMRLVRTGKVN
ncbi:methyltransferase, putative [Entamoeba invadens IP1]|uniref:tRNA (guanine(46)-N(7))-methyltransferase n=1 Tax=Entamoeba invadens IP1 TaxID=370355 RepID=A0A0A1UC09_ENTIV|nr:methyltransferase, putative [Entamoeba invadens IP1]ELP92761.1 methyltransferase, putative [Entamoeba invadens IP1]|eukprot:XP_004259532.1 methyltransferase, putative [Entamoeba invadens IP1]